MESSDRMRAILAFVHAAERGSFAAAARMLGISAAAVSKNVAGLERSLGVRLMNRTTRSLQLTGEGIAFFEHARVAIDALELAVDSVAFQRGAPAGKVRISTSSAFGRAYLLPVLPELHARYPALRVEVDFEDRRVDLVKDGYDLALRGGWLEDSGLVSRRIGMLHTILVASPAYLAQHGVPRTREALAGHRAVAVRFLNGRTSHWGFRQSDGGIEEVAAPSPVLTVSAPEAALDAALLGMGIAQVGVHHAWSALQSGQLKALLLDQHHGGAREIALQYPHRALLAPRVRVTVELLLERLAQVEALHVAPQALRACAA